MRADTRRRTEIILECVGRVFVYGETADCETLASPFNDVEDTTDMGAVAGTATSMLYGAVLYAASLLEREPVDLWQEIALFLRED